MTVLMILATFMFFVVIQRDIGDPRWQMFAAPAMFIIIGRGVMWLYDYFKKYSKVGTVTVLALLVLIGMISQIAQSDMFLEQRKNDQAGIKSAAEFINQ